MLQSKVNNLMTDSKVITSKTHSGRYTDLDIDKLRGGYYTPQDLASWLCAWAIRSCEERVLEPSCGDGAFLMTAAQRFSDLGLSNAAIANQLTGVEISTTEADIAYSQLSKLLGKSAADVIKAEEFFDWWKTTDQPYYDVIIGNPPFIRYQSFPEPHRSLAMELMQEQGLKANRLTNIWVPFVVAAVASLRAGGRLAMVLPAELLQVTYASQLRGFLTDRFKRIDIVTCNELFFKNAQQEVVLLLADDLIPVASENNVCQVTMTEALTVNAITSQTPSALLANAQAKTIQHDTEKWLKYFLSEREIMFMRDLRESGTAVDLSTHAHVNVGVVTGKNSYFVLNNTQVKNLGLEDFTLPLVSRTAHLKGARVTKDDWELMSSCDDLVHLLYLPDTTKLTSSVEEYIRFGEESGVNKGYKCSIRNPWYLVPSTWVPDGFFFRQIYDFPRVVINEAGATATDTLHRLSCKNDSPEQVISNTYTWLTAASAEIEGRSYGGGVLALEPKEAERILMPATLANALPLDECDRLIRAGRLNDVLEENARIILCEHMGLSKQESLILRDVWVKMRDRRTARKRSRSTK